MRKALLIVVMALFSVTVYASDPQEVLDIRARYQAVGQMIEGNKLFVFKLVRNATDIQVPHTGHYVTTAKYYFELNPDTGDPTDKLVKIEVITEYSDKKEYREFLFDSNGMLQFYYAVIRSNGVQTPLEESRLYYKDGVLIRVMEGAQWIPVDDVESGMKSGAAFDEMNFWKNIAKILNG